MSNRESEIAQTPTILRGNRTDDPTAVVRRPHKVAKTANVTRAVAGRSELSDIKTTLDKIQKNTDELLVEDRALRHQYEELKNLNFLRYLLTLSP